jgi:hypothetical protein
MRSVGAVSLILCLFMALAVGNAEARRKGTAKERAAIAARFDAPPKCARVWVSTVDHHWATYAFDGTKYDDPDCQPVAADGVAILRFRKGAWRTVTAGSSFDCPVPKTPAKIVKDLHVKCFDHG